jgi:hypothetical protein
MLFGRLFTSTCELEFDPKNPLEIIISSCVGLNNNGSFSQMHQLHQELKQYESYIESDLTFTTVKEVSKTFSEDFTFALKTQLDNNVAVSIIGESIPLLLS